MAKKTFENIISNLLGEPTSNLCHAFYDQYVEANVRFRSRAGMKTVIIRRQLGKCCNWCAERAGIFTLENAPSDIYGRHDRCKCMVTFKDGNGYTDVWSKKQFQTQAKARKSRENEILEEIEKKNIKRKLEESIFEGATPGEIKSILKRIKYKSGWEKYSLRDTIEKVLPPTYNLRKSGKWKYIYWSEDSNYEIVYDYGLNYFRIIDNSLPGRNYQKKYVDINGRNAHNITIKGKTKGRTNEEWQKATHFVNSDRE